MPGLARNCCDLRPSHELHTGGCWIDKCKQMVVVDVAFVFPLAGENETLTLLPGEENLPSSPRDETR